MSDYLPCTVVLLGKAVRCGALALAVRARAHTHTHTHTHKQKEGAGASLAFEEPLCLKLPDRPRQRQQAVQLDNAWPSRCLSQCTSCKLLSVVKGANRGDLQITC